MKINSPLPTYIGFEICYYSNLDLVQWAIKYLPASEHFSNDEDLIELASINEGIKDEIDKAGIYLKAFIDKQWPGFSSGNEKAEIYAKNYFKARLRQYLSGDCAPYDVCKMVTPIEQVYDFPKWLGNMYNDCDWIEPKTKSSECKYLEAEIQNALKL